jgi:glycosyltransferase involved in cell wall biosynthesis
VKSRLGLFGHQELLTYGLTDEQKGIEYAIYALPEIVRRHPETIYCIVGQTHPEEKEQQGERYRTYLQELAASLGVRHSMGGALLVGFVWLVQVMIREGISATAWGRYLYLFMGARQPGHPALVANQLTLVGLASALAVAGGLMLRRGERYL